MNNESTKKLATFRIEGNLWDNFVQLAKDNGTSASELLIEFVKVSLASGEVSKPSSIDSTNISLDSLDERIDELLGGERLRELIDTRIDERLSHAFAILGDHRERIKALEQNVLELNQVSPQFTTTSSPATPKATTSGLKSKINSLARTLKDRGHKIPESFIRHIVLENPELVANWKGEGREKILELILSKEQNK